MRSHTFNMRAFIEVAPDTFVSVGDLASSPDHVVGAIAVLRDQLRDVLHDLAPVFGAGTLLALCGEVIAEE